MSGFLVVRLLSGLDQVIRLLVEQTVNLAREQSLDVYAVGGAVRDVLLGIEHYDVDIVVDGDAIRLGEGVASRVNGSVTTFPAFGTATLKLGHARLDLSTVRSETYPRPGALPVVSPGTLGSDLARRDFSINALALKLTDPDEGSLIDRCGGERDLTGGLIRVLHDASFRDDPTRIWRAVRYAARLGFSIEPRTTELLKEGLGYVNLVSGIRLRRELERMAEESHASDAVRLARSHGLFAAVHSSLRVSERQIAAIRGLSDHLPATTRTCAFLALLLAHLSIEQADSAIQRLSLTSRQQAAVRDVIRLGAMEAGLGARDARPSDLVALLRGTSTDALEAFTLLTDDDRVRERVRSYLNLWCSVRPLLTGTDVEALGVRHGPDVGRALQALTSAKLDGAALTRQDEIALVEHMFRSAAPGVANG